MDKITATQFESLKKGLVTKSFEMLDVNGDKIIDKNDLAAAKTNSIRSDLHKLLNSTDEELTLDGKFDLNDIGNNNQVSKTASGNTNKTSAAKASTTASAVTTSSNSTSSNSASTPSLPAGYENVDVSNLSGKSKEELEALLAKIENNISLITARMTTLDAEYSQLSSDIATLQSTNSTLTAQLEELAANKKAEEDKLPDAEQKVTDESEKLTNYTDEYEVLCEQLERINSRIRSEQHYEEMQYERSMASIADDAIKNYDPEADGDDFEAYYLDKMNSMGYIAFSGLGRLNRQAEIYATDAGKKLQQIIDQSKVVYDAKANLANIQANIQRYADEMEPIQAQIDANSALISEKQGLQTTNRTEYNMLSSQKSIEEGKKSTINTQITALSQTTTTDTPVVTPVDTPVSTELSAADVLALIPQAEKDLAKEKNVDLTKCYIAQGKQDGVWHIYMSDGKSVARKYGTKNSSGRGYDLIAKGNGKMKKIKESDSGSTVYLFTSINSDMTDGTVTSKKYSYETSSPLSFDVNGDGLHTSSNTVQFDIDGDGELDTINNSAEWVLAFDKDHNGIAGENGSELFGDNTDLDGDGKADGYADGFAALKALAKKEGLIGNNDNVLNENDINILTKKYGLTMTNGYGGESKTLSELGITQINLAQTDETYTAKDFDGNQNDIMRQDGATFVINGETREYADFWHSKKDESSSATQESTSDNIKKILATTNQEDVTLELNDRGIIALKGKVDYNSIKNKFVNDQDIINEGKQIAKKYTAAQEEKAAQEKKDALAEENKKSEEKKTEQKAEDQKTEQQKAENQKAEQQKTEQNAEQKKKIKE